MNDGTTRSRSAMEHILASMAEASLGTEAAEGEAEMNEAIRDAAEIEASVGLGGGVAAIDAAERAVINEAKVFMAWAWSGPFSRKDLEGLSRAVATLEVAEKAGQAATEPEPTAVEARP